MFTIKEAYSIARYDFYEAALTTLGFKRVTTVIRSRLDALIDNFINEGRIEEINGRLVLKASEK